VTAIGEHFMPIIGIDLGTTNSLVACFIDGKSVIIPNALGENLTPSVVSVLENGEIITGSAAKERLITHPQLTAATFKRYMGTGKKYNLGKITLTPIELSSFILKALKEDAEAFLRTKITETIISVPAYFNDEQRRATKQAGELAGLKVERLINEPTASAVAYGLHRNEDESKFLIFDLGGGTFDVSILEIFENVMEVRAVAGNNFLGGEDFTAVLMSRFLKHCGIDINSLDRKTYAGINKQAENCKIALSDAEKADMSYTINEKNYTLTITSDEFKQLSEELLEKLKKPIQVILKDSALYSKDLDNIILVGGSTKMYIIRRFVTNMFKKFPLYSLNPDEVVALGAGIYAAMKERNESLKEKVLTDVCPYTLGVSIAMSDGRGGYEFGHFLPIIERNTVVPFSKVETLYTISDNQQSISVKIYQGESRLVDNNVKIGELNIPIPPAPKGEASIDVRYTYDINGILEVEVTNQLTGEKRRQVINNSSSTMTEAEIEKRLQELEELKIHPRDNAKNRYLIAKAERLYEETLSDTRNIISQATADFEAVLSRQMPNEIKAFAKKFEEFLDSIDQMEYE